MTDGGRSAHVASSLDSLRRVIRVLRLGARQAEERTGLSPAQLFVLQQVAAAEQQSITELATRTVTDRSSVAAMVDRLALRGLVERVQGAEDRRRTEVRLTPTGRRTLDGAPRSPTQDLLDGLDRLDDAALERLSVALGDLVRVIQASDEPATMFFEDPTPAAAGRRRSRHA